ncbi:hypothetical protein KI387_027424, partial [Taxus chinensis]
SQSNILSAAKIQEMELPLEDAFQDDPLETIMEYLNEEKGGDSLRGFTEEKTLSLYQDFLLSPTSEQPIINDKTTSQLDTYITRNLSPSTPMESTYALHTKAEKETYEIFAQITLVLEPEHVNTLKENGLRIATDPYIQARCANIGYQKCGHAG